MKTDILFANEIDLSVLDDGFAYLSLVRRYLLKFPDNKFKMLVTACQILITPVSM